MLGMEEVMKRAKSNCEAIIDAGNLAYAHGMQAVEHALSGDAESASAFARDAHRAAVTAMRLVRPQRCCSATHYPGETCVTFGMSASQIEVNS